MKISPLVSLGHDNSVKDLIILTLSQEWPLTVRKIHNAIEKSRASVTYHAVHKAVRQLVKQNVLKKERNGYLISIEWIEQMSGLVEGMKNNYLYNKPLYLPGLKEFKQEGDTQVFIFDNLAEADSYRKRLQWEYGNRKGAKQPYVSMGLHFRTPLLYTEKSRDLSSVASKFSITCYLVVTGKTPVDEWCADFYRLQKHFVKTGVPSAQNCEINVLGDTIVQAYLPPQVRQRIHDIYSNVKDVSEINHQDFYKQIYLTKGDVKIVVMKNPEIAEQIRNQVIANFRNEKVAVFDIDGTFVDPAFPVEATEMLNAKGLLNAGEGKELAELCGQYKAGKLKRDKFADAYMKIYPKAVKGKAAASIEEAIAKFVEENTFRFIYPHAEKLYSLVHSYRKAIVFTRLPVEFVRSLSGMFVFDEIISTKLELSGGIFTGKVAANLCMPGSKEKAFVKWLQSNGSSLKGSLGFGDRYHDLSFLSRVDMPFVLNPDEKLAKVAKQNRWPAYNGDTAKLLFKVREVLANGD